MCNLKRRPTIEFATCSLTKKIKLFGKYLVKPHNIQFKIPTTWWTGQMENTVVIFTSDNGAGERYTHIIIWSLFTSFICTLNNIFIWSFLVHFFCISVKQTYPSKACVDPSMKWAYENNNLNLIFFYIQCIGKICGSREPWEFLHLSTVPLCRPVRGVWGGRQSEREK